MLTENHIKKIWSKMTRIYGHRWSSSFGVSDDGTWLSALQDMPEDMILSGLHRCLNRTDPWPPSLPEFRQMCLNLPSIDKVLSEVISGQCTNELTYLVSKKIPSFDKQTKTEKQLRQMVIGHYDDCYAEASKETIDIYLSLGDKQKQIGNV